MAIAAEEIPIANEKLFCSSDETGRRLKIARKDKENDYSLSQVSRMTKVSKSYLSEIEHGTACSLEVINKLCNAYSILPEMVLFFDYNVMVLKGSKVRGSGSRLKSFSDSFSKRFNALSSRARTST